MCLQTISQSPRSAISCVLAGRYYAGVDADRKVLARTARNYGERAWSEEGVRVFIDEKRIIDYWKDDWTGEGNVPDGAELSLDIGEHVIQIEYLHTDGPAGLYFHMWPVVPISTALPPEKQFYERARAAWFGGDPDHAVLLYRDALKVQRAKLPPQSPESGANPQRFRLLVDVHETARSWLRREAAEIRQAILDPADAEGRRVMLETWRNLANCLADRGQLGQAETLFGHVLTRQQDAFGPDHEEAAVSRLRLAAVLVESDKLTHAQCY